VELFTSFDVGWFGNSGIRSIIARLKTGWVSQEKEYKKRWKIDRKELSDNLDFLLFWVKSIDGSV
jgi:hypothetical protein